MAIPERPTPVPSPAPTPPPRPGPGGLPPKPIVRPVIDPNKFKMELERRLAIVINKYKDEGREPPQWLTDEFLKLAHELVANPPPAIHA